MAKTQHLPGQLKLDTISFKAGIQIPLRTFLECEVEEFTFLCL